MNPIVAALSKLLEPADRECAGGDLEELQLSAPAAAGNILGLVTRRQMAEWSHWGPWVALFGVAGVAGFFLSGSLAGVETGIFLQIRTYLHYGITYQPGGVSVAQELTYIATAAVAVLLWSWACGFVLASLSGRTLWLTSSLFYCIVQDSWAIRLSVTGGLVMNPSLWRAMLLRLLPLGPPAILFLFALLLGIRSARNGMLQRNTRLSLTAFGLSLVFLLVWMESWFVAGFAHWRGQSYLPTPFLYRLLPWLAGAWPLFSTPLLSDGRQEPEHRTA